MDNARVHRFGHRVAVALPGNGETVYLMPEEAHHLANALKMCTADIELHPRFSESQFTSVEVPVLEPHIGR